MSNLFKDPTNKRERIFNRHKGQCAYCGADLKKKANPWNDWDDRKTEYQTDHIIPRAQGGSDKEENLVAACYECNADKGPLNSEEYYDKCFKRKMAAIREIQRLETIMRSLKENFEGTTVADD